MNFYMADSFEKSLGKLSGAEQKAAKLAAMDLQLDRTRPGLQCHRLENIKEKGFWSARASQDLRLIFHQMPASIVLAFVGHHDHAYKWAANRKFEIHPDTGAFQIVVIPEIIAPPPDRKPPQHCPLAKITEAEFLAHGVPSAWIPQLQTADEDELLRIAEQLPAEAAEAVLAWAMGTKPPTPIVFPPDRTDPFQHPDARRRFRLLAGTRELEQALEYPWDQWILFLHPSQRDCATRSFNGPARVQGSAGTGKTIVALHRATHLARSNPQARILLTTFSAPLAALLQEKLHRLVAAEPALLERLDVCDMRTLGERMHTAQLGKPQLIAADDLHGLIRQHAPAEISRVYGDAFVLAEFREIVDAFHLRDWDSYRDVRRLGRKARLNEAKRLLLWQGFEPVLQELAAQNLITEHQLFHRSADQLQSSGARPYQHIVVDECQDINAGQLRLLAALAGTGSNSLFFAGDLGQQIFQQPFSWNHHGVDLRGRSRTLRINYRTSHQIRRQADRLLDLQTRDVDGTVQDRGGTQSVFNGPNPQIQAGNTPEQEQQHVADWIQQRLAESLQPREFGIFVRSEAEISRAEAALQLADLPYERLQPSAMRLGSKATLSTMHLAKGLEFRAVVVMACDEDVIPNAERIKAIIDDSDLDEVVATERHLLYVACTRARDHLLITSGPTCSEFVEDLIG